MTVKSIDFSDLPKARRNRVSPIKRTQDWQEALRRIRSTEFDAIMVEFSPETLKLGKSVPDRFRRLLAAEIKAMGLDSFVRLTFRRDSPDGTPVLYIVRRQGMELPRKRERQKANK